MIVVVVVVVFLSFFFCCAYFRRNEQDGHRPKEEEKAVEIKLGIVVLVDESVVSREEKMTTRDSASLAAAHVRVMRPKKSRIDCSAIGAAHTTNGNAGAPTKCTICDAAVAVVSVVVKRQASPSQRRRQP